MILAVSRVFDTRETPPAMAISIAGRPPSGSRSIAILLEVVSSRESGPRDFKSHRMVAAGERA